MIQVSYIIAMGVIGVYDSGVGGLSVWKELLKELPQEEYLYVSDAGYCPYGPKSK